MNRLQMLLVYPVCVAGALVTVFWMPIAILIGSPRSYRIILASDRLANATFGGSDRETISSRAYRGSQEGKRIWCLLCKLLHKVQADHCKLSDGV
jgi:hypothetical protein